MTYALIENGSIAKYPLSEISIKSLHPNTSFPVPFEAPDGYVKVHQVDPPTFDHTKNLIEADPVNDGGVWTQAWTVVDASQAEINARTADKARVERSERNQLLSASDWTQLSDAPVDTAAWASYRQELRDITLQAGFPWEITWPEEPV